MVELKSLPLGATAPPSTILVVDDNPVNLQLLVRTLDGHGHRILAAKNGRAALDIARQVHPDLILLDVMMPDLGGFEVCSRLKADAATQETAVIFLSALGDVEDKVVGLTLGAVDYITKPIQPEEVQVRVSNHLVRPSRPRARQGGTAPAATAALHAAVASGARIRCVLSDQPSRRRRLLRRARPGRFAFRRCRG
jgi:DNA-binding response OmpR family regulator